MPKNKLYLAALLSAVGVMVLLPTVAGAAKGKDKSRHLERRNDREYGVYERFERFEGDRAAWDNAKSAWSVGGSWHGSRGGVEVVVHGGSPSAPYSGPSYRGRRGAGRSWGIPPGHLPPPGACRVWLPDRPPGHQPPATSCAFAEAQARRYGGAVIYGGR